MSFTILLPADPTDSILRAAELYQKQNPGTTILAPEGQGESFVLLPMPEKERFSSRLRRYFRKKRGCERIVRFDYADAALAYLKAHPAETIVAVNEPADLKRLSKCGRVIFFAAKDVWGEEYPDAKWALAYAEKIFTATESLKASALAAGLDEAKISVFPLPIPEPVFLTEAEKTDRRTAIGLGDRKLIVCPDELTPSSGALDAVKAMSHLVREDLFLLLSGKASDAEYLAMLASEADPARVLIREDTNAVALADLILFPTLAEETDGYFLKEAVTYGLPIFTSNARGAEEVLAGVPHTVIPCGLGFVNRLGKKLEAFGKD